MTVMLKVLAVLLLSLPPGAYVAGRIAGPPELSAYGHSVTTAPPSPAAPRPARERPARPDRPQSTLLVEVSADRTRGGQGAEGDASAADKGEARRGAARGDGTRTHGRVTPDIDTPRRSQWRPEMTGPEERRRPDEPSFIPVPEPTEPRPADGSVEMHGDSTEILGGVEVVRGDGYEAEAEAHGYDDSPGDGSVVIEGGEPW
jgi:hypothetical protein